jgi:cytochrome c peroxidase
MLRISSAILLVVALSGCGSGTNIPSSTGGTAAAAPSAAAQLGDLIFNDKELSVSGRQSCATCHVARFAFAADPTETGPDHGSPVPLGGPDMELPGFRNAPSLMYASFSPNFFFDGDGNPNGGFFRDGRAATLAAQAQQPFVTAFEMANADAAAVLVKLRSRPYFPQFLSLYGQSAASDANLAIEHIGQALAAFETENTQFHPFTTKFDYWRRGEAQLTAQELRGLGLFNNPAKGNCAACHPSSAADDSTPPLFTDFSYDKLGLPRNSLIPANLDSGAPPYTPINGDDGIHIYYDLGVCGPLRAAAGKNLSGLCGQFKVPTLRNIALTAPYFHNGRFATLADAVGFYVRRDTNPDQSYPTTSDGRVTKFDDLPALYGGQFVVNVNDPNSSLGYVGNVNTSEIPYNRILGGTPALDAGEINDVIAFLCALTDGYDPNHPAALTLPPQCAAAVAAAASQP